MSCGFQTFGSCITNDIVDTTMEEDLDGNVDFDFFDSPKKISSPKADNKKEKRRGNYLQDGGIEIPVESDDERPSKGKKKIEARVPTISSERSRRDSSDTDGDVDNSRRRSDRSYRRYKESKLASRSRSSSRSRDVSADRTGTSEGKGPSKQAWSEKKHSPRSHDSSRSGGSRSPRRVDVGTGIDAGPKKQKTKKHKKKYSSSSDSASYDSDSDVSKGSKSSSETGSGSSSGSDSSNTSSSDTDSDITDVSPIASPDPNGVNRKGHQDAISPRRRKRTYSGEKSPRHKDHVQYTNSGTMTHAHELLNSGSNDRMDLNLLMQAVLEMDKDRPKGEKGGRRVIILPSPGAGNKDRKNLSFGNSRVRDIDRENQRLLKNIMTKESPKKKIQKKPISFESLRRITPAAVNRQRDQRRIEMENLEMLKRLHGVRPTKGMSRGDQLSDYRRQALLGVPTFTANAPPQRKPTSPYTNTLSNRSRSMTSLRSATSMHNGGISRGRPVSAKQRPVSAKNGPTGVQNKRPVSAKFKEARENGKPRPGSAKNGPAISKCNAWVEWEPGW